MSKKLVLAGDMKLVSSLEQVDVHRCMMWPCVAVSQEIHGKSRSIVPSYCAEPVHETIAGIDLCWVHASSVKAGLRPLPIVELKKTS